MESNTSSGANLQASPRLGRIAPVLQVNVLPGMSGEEANNNNGNNNNVSSSGVGGATLHASAINLSRGAALANLLPGSSVVSARRLMGDGGNPNSAAFSSTTVNGAAGGLPSTLAKPVLDPSQVRCCPPDQWVQDAHVMNCMAPDCTNSFSLFNRKHRCRMCGRVFCASSCNNLVYISAASAAKVMPANGGGGSGGAEALGTGAGGVGGSTPSAGSLDPVSAATGAGDGGGSSGGLNSDVSPNSVNPSTLATPLVGGTNSNDGGAGALNGAGGPVAAAGATTAVGAAAQPPYVPCRVCASCFYEVQLVVPRRQENGNLRRRSRGELKMIQRVLLVNIMTYLNLFDLVNVGLVSADFYFMSRDNVIWYQYNMARWMQESDVPQLSSLKSRAAALRAQQRGTTWYGGGNTANTSLADDIFHSTPVIQDATALSESEAAKRVISLHARYNYTQFLDFARRQEMARCEGLSSFSLGARILLSSPIRIAVIGPCGIGKTAAVSSFLGEKTTQMVVRPTIGFERRTILVRLAGGLSTEVMLHLFDLSGADRYGELRRFVCRHCHVLCLCYDPSQKVTLVQAADIMMDLEPALGPQPVVVCGLLRHTRRRAATAPAECNERDRASASTPTTNNGSTSEVTASAAATPEAAPLLSPQSNGVLCASAKRPATLAQSASRTPPNIRRMPPLEEHRRTHSTPVIEDTAAVDLGCAAAAASSNGDIEGRVGRRERTAVMDAAETDVNVPSLSSVPRDGTRSPSSTNGPFTPLTSDTDGAAVVHAASPPHRSALPPPPSPAAAATVGGATSSIEVTAEEAVGITVRGLASIQCPMLHPTALFEAAVQALMDQLGDATVASTTTISEISAELSMQSECSPNPSMLSRGSSSPGRGVPASAMRSSVRRRRPGASRTIVQDLLNLTMQPSAIDILLDRK